MIEFDVLDRPLEVPDGVAAVLPEVLVPMYWWRGVPFERAEPVSMTPLERFALELALTTGRADPDEFFEITNLPGATLLPVAARRLVAARALAPADGGYVPLFPGAERAARTQTVYERRLSSLDVVLLPLTGDLLALDPRSSRLREVERLRPRPVGSAPVSPRLAGVRLVDHLSARLRDGTLAGVPDDLTGLARPPAESPPICPDGWCPVYRCRGELRRGGDRYRPAVTLPAEGRRDPVTVELPGADGLAGRWLALVDAFGDPATRARAWDGLLGGHARTAPHAERTGPGRWSCRLSPTAALRLADRGRNLALPLGMTVRGDDAVVEVAIDLRGEDQATLDLIRRDGLLTAAAQPGADPTPVPRTPAMRQRAWQLGFPGLVYALREAEDFGYA